MKVRGCAHVCVLAEIVQRESCDSRKGKGGGRGPSHPQALSLLLLLLVTGWS